MLHLIFISNKLLYLHICHKFFWTEITKYIIFFLTQRYLKPWIWDFSDNSFKILKFSCYCSVFQPRPTLCQPMHCSSPGFSVLHHFPEFAQVHVLSIGGVSSISSSDALFCLQSFPESGTFPMSNLFSSDDQYTQASVLHQPFQWMQ